MFRNIIDEEIKTILKEKKIIVQFKNIKEKKMHVDSMRFSSTKSMHLKKIVIRVAFLRLMYVVVYSIVNVMIENLKIKAIFNNEAKINCMFKWLIDAVELSMRWSISIIIINVINKRARFFNVCEIVSISINNIIILISVIVVKFSDHELFLKKFFQRATRMNSINLNNELFEIIVNFLNEKKRINFFKMSAEHVSNKEKKSQCLQ